jgi:hypothetical protein
LTERPAPLIAPRSGEDGEEQRFREALERLGTQIVQTLDAAIGMRTAHPDVQRNRHLARGHVQDALLRAQNTFHLHRALGISTRPRTHAKEQ